MNLVIVELVRHDSLALENESSLTVLSSSGAHSPKILKKIIGASAEFERNLRRDHFAKIHAIEESGRVR